MPRYATWVVKRRTRLIWVARLRAGSLGTGRDLGGFAVSPRDENLSIADQAYRETETIARAWGYTITNNPWRYMTEEAD